MRHGRTGVARAKTGSRACVDLSKPPPCSRPGRGSTLRGRRPASSTSFWTKRSPSLTFSESRSKTTLADVDVRGAGDRIRRKRLTGVLEAYLQVLSASPGLAFAFGTVAVGPDVAGDETLLKLFQEAGVDQATSTWLSICSSSMSPATAAERHDGVDPGSPAGGSVVSDVGASTRVSMRPASCCCRAHGEERFAWAIDVLLKGILRASDTGAASHHENQPVTADHAGTSGRHFSADAVYCRLKRTLFVTNIKS